MQPTIQFAGKIFWAADILISSGAKPSTAVLSGSSSDSYDTDFYDLFISSDSQQYTIPKMRVVNSQNKPLKWKGMNESQIVLEDRRALWWEVYHSLDYNRIRCDGERINEKNCKEIFEELLGLVGEGNADLAFARDDIYPTMSYNQNLTVGQMLDDLCKKSMHTIGFTATGLVGVYALGSGGQQLIPDNMSTLKAFRQDTQILPGSYSVISAPTVFESEIELEAKAMEDDGELVDIGDASYKPSGGWGDQWPGQYSSVASNKQWLAMRSLYKIFKAGAATNDETTADSTLSGDIIVIKDGMCVWDEEVSAVVVEKVRGEFWCEYHRGDLSTNGDDQWYGMVECVGNVFYFDRPVFKISGGQVSEPTLKATARHLVRKSDGKMVCEKSGAGPEVLVDWLIPVLRHGIGSNVSDIDDQLLAMLTIVNADASVLSRVEVHTDIIPVQVNGQARAVRYKVGSEIATSGFADTEVYFGRNWEGLMV